MNPVQVLGTVYLCPLHGEVRQARPGKCPTCGMDLMPEGARFALLRHMVQNPMSLGMMLVAMFGIVALVITLLILRG
jgi:hypothetical protein